MLPFQGIRQWRSAGEFWDSRFESLFLLICLLRYADNKSVNGCNDSPVRSPLYIVYTPSCRKGISVSNSRHYRSRRWLRGLFACGFCACSLGVALAGPFDVVKFPIQRAQTPATVGNSEIDLPAKPLRLNYQNSSWEKVLKDLAEESGSTLVMKDPPPGRFSRRDGNQYALDEAVRVLNYTLEKEGFRLIKQDDYLIVIKLEDVRTRYERSTVAQPTAKYPTKKQGAIEPGEMYRWSSTSISPNGKITPNGNQKEEVPQEIHQLSHQVPLGKLDKSLPYQPVINIKTSLNTRHPALDVARIFYESFGKKAQLVRSGPDGLPSFLLTQHETIEDSDILLAIGIDSDENRLVLEGPEAATREAKQTIELIQRSVDNADEVLKIVPSSVDVSKLAKTLEPSMNRLLALHAQQAAQEQAIEQGIDPAQIKATGNPLGAELRSNVTVQAMPDLGVLILSGNEKDVEAVMAVIEEIEKLSVGTSPAIQLLILQHVDATQLSVLMESVYEDLTSRKPGATPTETPQGTAERSKVTFIPVTKPNALIILAPEADIPSILELAEELDQPVDPLTEFEVFALKSAIATQVAELVTNFFADRESLGGTVSAFADVRSNSLIVRARPRDLEEASALIHKLDRDASGAMNQLKVIPLKNSVAQELADVINSAFQSLQLPQGQDSQLGGAGSFNLGGTGESSTQLREIKSLAVEFLASSGGKDELIRSGILADIRVTADSRINSLIVTAPSRSMKLMLALIERLDQIPSSIAEIKVFTLRNSDATQAVDLLNSLFAQTATGGGGGNNNSQQSSQGLQIAGATDVSNTLVSLRFSADVRTNSIVAVGGADSLKVVEAILLRLDEDDLRQRQTTVIKLKNSPAADVSEAVNQFLDSQRELAEAQPDLISNIELLEQEIIVVPEAVTNSLLVSATPRYFSIIQNMVARLDEAPPQVIIQALLVEVELENTDEFGIELGLQDSILFDRSLMGVPGFLFNSVNLGNDVTADPNALGGQGLSNFGVGRSNNDLGFGGLVLSASSENISVLIRALASRRNVQVLSRPQIRTLDNQEASIQVGQQVPIVNGVNVTSLGNANPTIEQQDVGLILTVRPRINPDGTIVMETAAVKSQLDGSGVPVFINDDGSSIESPIIDITSANTTVSVPNGHTIVMGGIITESDETIERKVPWLGDVPIIGRAFRFDSTNSTRSELLIFLTPRIILNDSDSEFIKQVETERTHMIEEQAEEVHGPIFGVPPTMNGMQPMQAPIQLPDGSFINPASYEPSSQRVPNQSDLNTYRRTPGVRPAKATTIKEEKPSGVRRLWPFR